MLTRDGRQIGGEKEQRMTTPLGTLVYKGGVEEREYLWSRSGWWILDYAGKKEE
ncbi:MAG: hypothetical protein ACLFMP_00185 [Desulfonatronovibrionaceae bacterium]